MRIAVIGCGRFANRVHFPSLTSFDDVEIVGICDLDRARLNATGERFGVASRFTDFVAMLEETRPDGVYVIMPENVRFPVVKKVLVRGFNVFMEKPPASTTGEIRTLAALAEEKRAIAMVGCNRRFIPVLVEARGRMHARGPVTQVVATYYKNEIASTVMERPAPDVLVSDGIHAVDTLRWLADSEPVAARGFVRRIGANYDNAWQAVVSFENGCTGVLLLSWAAGNRFHSFEIHTPGATAYIIPEQFARVTADGVKDDLWTMPSDANLDSDAAYLRYGFLQENRHFIDCLKNGEQTRCPFADAAKSMELVDLIKAGAEG